MPELTRCIFSAGVASTSRTSTAATAEIAGRASTRLSTAPHIRLSPSPRRMRCRNGTRPLSTLLPSAASTAGTTVTEPIMATATTMIAPMPSCVNVLSPARNIPAMAAMTVNPEISTARPDVAAAVSTASCLLAPLRTSSRSRRR